MNQSLTELAHNILFAQKRASETTASRLQEERRKKEADILESFKSTFHDLLPSLEKDGITYSAHFKATYEHKGSYILFKKGDRTLKMDYTNAISYRYEYTSPGDPYGRMCYGAWPKDDFILFLYKGLLEDEEFVPVIPNNFKEE